MKSPCHRCDSWGCALPDRRADCLGAYDNLRAIANSPGGFAAGEGQAASWTPAERLFYDRMTK